jgi:hypothetical protein
MKSEGYEEETHHTFQAQKKQDKKKNKKNTERKQEEISMNLTGQMCATESFHQDQSEIVENGKIVK